MIAPVIPVPDQPNAIFGWDSSESGDSTSRASFAGKWAFWSMPHALAESDNFMYVAEGPLNLQPPTVNDRRRIRKLPRSTRVSVPTVKSTPSRRTPRASCPAT